jgi:hypothetical protein
MIGVVVGERELWEAVGRAVIARRCQLGLTLLAAVDASGGRLGRAVWSQIENAHGTRHQTRVLDGVAAALGWETDWVDLIRAGRPPVVAGSRPVPVVDAVVSDMERQVVVRMPVELFQVLYERAVRRIVRWPGWSGSLSAGCWRSRFSRCSSRRFRRVACRPVLRLASLHECPTCPPPWPSRTIREPRIPHRRRPGHRAPSRVGCHCGVGQGTRVRHGSEPRRGGVLVRGPVPGPNVGAWSASNLTVGRCRSAPNPLGGPSVIDLITGRRPPVAPDF